MPGTLYETRTENISDDFDGDDGFIQGCAVSADNVFATSGNPSYIAKFDRVDLSFISENGGVVDSPMSGSDAVPNNSENKLQTSYYHDGTVYGFCRAPEIHEINPDTLDYTGTSHYEVVPESEWVDNPDVFEGITRYDGSAFGTAKWFVNLKGAENGDDRAVYRLDENFNHEETYIVNDNNPVVEGLYHGPDGISVFDIHGRTILVGSVTSREPEHEDAYPGLTVFEYDNLNDEFDYLGLARVYDNPFLTPDEGFQVVETDEVFAALRYPKDFDDTREPNILESNWNSILAHATVGDATLGDVTFGGV